MSKKNNCSRSRLHSDCSRTCVSPQDISFGALYIFKWIAEYSPIFLMHTYSSNSTWDYNIVFEKRVFVRKSVLFGNVYFSRYFCGPTTTTQTTTEPSSENFFTVITGCRFPGCKGKYFRFYDIPKYEYSTSGIRSIKSRRHLLILVERVRLRL